MTVSQQILTESFSMQVNPHTHQVKICDFGSAIVLVCFMYVCVCVCVSVFSTFTHSSWNFSYLGGFTLFALTFDRWKANQIYHRYVLDIIEHLSLYLEQLNILQLGVLVELMLGQVGDCWGELLWFCGLVYVKINLFLFLFFQPLFPGESGVDQLAEIIKVIFMIIFFVVTVMSAIEIYQICPAPMPSVIVLSVFLSCSVAFQSVQLFSWNRDICQFSQLWIFFIS